MADFYLTMFLRDLEAVRAVLRSDCEVARFLRVTNGTLTHWRKGRFPVKGQVRQRLEALVLYLYPDRRFTPIAREKARRRWQKGGRPARAPLP